MLTILTGELEPTPTYRSRSWVWVSNGSGFVEIDRTLPGGEVVRETIPALGKLTIKQQFRHRRYRAVSHTKNGVTYRAGRPRSCEIDTYAVAEVEPQHPGTRAFLLLNLTDDEQQEPYLVHVGGVETCRCRAGLCKIDHCKHRAGLDACIEAGGLDPEPDVAPAEPQYRDYYAEMPPLEPCPF